MTFAFNQPAWLLALAFVLLPLGLIGAKTSRYAWLGLIPADAGAISVTVILKFLGATALFTLVLGLAGLHTTGQVLERIGLGANIVLLLDRSNSMDNSFAGSLPDGGQESKAAAARRLLKSFINERPHDLLGIVEYSTSPLFVLPLTDNKQALQAAIDATTLPALAYTHVSKGLSMALSLFDKPDLTGSRMVLLVSDGAAAIDASSELALRQYFKQQQVRLYWLFLRSSNSPGIFDLPSDKRDDNAQVMPERHLHLFFQSLNIPYKAYQAETPDAMRQAIADIDKLEQTPLYYQEQRPKHDLSGICYGVALSCISLLLLAKFMEWRDENSV